MSSQFCTGVLLAALTAIIVLLGRMLGGQTGMVFVFFLAMVIVLQLGIKDDSLV